MEQQIIEVEPRTGSGKGASRKVRATGRIPGVLYGHKQPALSFTIDPQVLRKKVKASALGRNTVFTIKGLGREVTALLKDAQIHPLRREIVHVDFVEVRDTDRIVVDVPVELVGKPEGVTDGGVLQSVRRAIAVECSVLDIPRLITVDVTHLKMGMALHVNDVTFPPGTKNGYPGNFAIASVQAPRAEIEATVAPVEGVEGVEGAVPVEGAAVVAPAEAEAPAGKRGAEGRPEGKKK